MKNLFTNVCLLLMSCVVGLALCEVSLRLFYPKYRHLADARFSRDAERIWSRTPHQRSYMTHPDTGLPHLVYHNNLALRQHRNFSEADLAAATNIGVFGDSFTENIRMPVQYSFTEPLDYLLNQSGKSFNVLNFGVDGYRPGQSLLHYEHFRYAEDLAHVVYVYCENDLRDIWAEGLFSLDEAGHLVRNEPIPESWWTPLVRQLHTLYLVLDANGRLSSFLAEAMIDFEDLRAGYNERAKGEKWRVMTHAIYNGRLDNDDLKNSVAIFRQVIRRWKHLVEHDGGTFSVVLLPGRSPQPSIVALLRAEDVEVIDLYACFRAPDTSRPQRREEASFYHFKKDYHWNEAGNRLAAVCLYRVLAEKTGLPPLSESRLSEALFRYYATFGGFGGRGDQFSLETAAAIREKYTPLETDTPLKDLQEEGLNFIGQPEKRITLPTIRRVS